MAFAKQYFSSYKSNNNLDYYLEIWVDGFDSSATEISIGAGGPVISYETDQEDRFSPILSSQCELPFVVKDTSLQAFIQLLRTTYKERQVYLHLYRATSSTYTTTKPIWSGFLVMDLGSGIDVSFPYEQKLTFVDGLSLLKDIDFVDLSNAGSETNIQGSYTQDNMYYGPAIYTFWIKEILAKAGVATTTQGVSIDYGFTTAVNWYNADMQNTNQGSDPLGLTQCVVSMFHNKNDQDVFTPENCYTVLKELLRHWGARITYWKHEFWIVQIPEYIQDESGLIDNPDNINSRQYNRFGTLTGSQDHLGDTYYTRYEQTIQSNQVSKLVGTKYNYLPMIHNAKADFLSFASKNYYGGFPYGVSAESQEIFQGTIIDPSTANFLWLSIPLNWTWDMTGSSLTAGHENGWWCSVRFNFYASDGTTTYYLQYDSSGQGSYYWVLEADWAPLGNTSPKYIIKSRNLTETNYIGFQENIPFVDSSGSAITMTGAWSFFLDIEDFANQSSSGNNGSFYCRFSGYAQSSFYDYVKKDPYQEFPYLPTTGDVSGGGPQTKSGTVRWSNTLENPSGVTTTSFSTPAGFDAGTSQADIQLITTSPFKGLLQTLNTTQTSSFGLSLYTQVDNSTNTETFSFGTLLWGDAIQQFAVGCLRVNNGSAFVKTNPSGEWGRGTLTGTNTFTELLIDEFLSGQIKVVIAPTMRLAVGEENKNQTATGTGGPATRPRYVNPIGRLREFRSNETDPEYIFRRGSFHSLYDEWDYEGYQILRDTVTTTTTTTDIGDLGGTQDNKPLSNAKIIPNVTDALMLNSPVASIRTTVPATGSNVAVNGNFNTAVGWTLGTGWSIDTTAKKAKFAATGSTSELTQSVLTQGLTYQVNFQVVVTAGTLLVKAGTSGTSQSITTSGDYSLYLDCDGSNLIKFQAGTTFTGNITYITLRDQKSISSVPINSIGSTVFKSGDTFNLINSLGGEILPLTVSSNQGATDDTISVTSTALFDDIGIDSVLLINQDDLSAQYQNKTKGTVGGFDITATSIDSGSVAISSYIDDDSFGTASATSLATSESIKNYVDGQVSATDSLQEVTTIGNTTTNSIMIGSSSAPSDKLDVYGNIKLIQTQNYIKFANDFVTVKRDGNNNLSFNGYGGFVFYNTQSSSEHMRLTSGGNLLIGTTTDSGEVLNISKSGTAMVKIDSGATFPYKAGVEFLRSSINGGSIYNDGSAVQIKLESYFNYQSAVPSRGGFMFKTAPVTSGTLVDAVRIDARGYVGILNSTPTEALHVVGKGIFTDQVTIPATPVASTDAASKGYVDAQVGSADTLQEVTDNGNTTTNSVMIGSSSSPSYPLQVTGSIKTTNKLLVEDSSNSRLELASSISNQARISAHKTNLGQTLPLLIQAEGIKFGTVGGGEKMRLTSAGYFGIGTTSPSSPLTVAGRVDFQGDLRLRGTDSLLNQGVVRFFVDSNNKLYIDTANDGANLFAIDSSGQVTIPATPVASTDAASKSYVDGQVGANDTLQEVTDNGNTTTNSITFAGGTSTGNILINRTDSTEARLTINTNKSFGRQFYLENKGNVQEIVAENTLTVKTYNNDTQIVLEGGSSTDNIQFITDESEGMRLTTTGLGIGTTSPSVPLEVYSSGTDKLKLTDDDGSNVIFGIGGNLFSQDLSASAQYRIRINNSEKIRLDSAGNLGINTSFPSEKLHVVGDILATGDSHADAFKPAVSGNPIKFKNFDSTTEFARITDGGNLLIGTTFDFSAKLQVVSNTNPQLILSGNSGAGISFIDTDTSQEDYQIIVGANDMAFRRVSDASDRIRLYGTTGNIVLAPSSGNVLIGTTTDDGSSKLQVNGSATFGAFVYAERFRTTVAGSASFAAIYMNSDSNSGLFQPSPDNIGFTTAASEKMRLTSSGNLLIGTTTDSGSKLKVEYAGGSPNGIIVKSTSNRSKIAVADNNTIAYVIAEDSFASYGMQDNLSANNLNINNSGNVLIGTTTDNGEKLQVNGNIKIGDSDILKIGDGNDLQILHNSTESFLHNSTGNLTVKTDTGDIKIRNFANGRDVILETDNGTGGTTPYITLDGSQTTINLQQIVLIGTTTNSGVYKLDVAGKARVQSVFELDDVLTLNQISTPADPASGKSSIYMDSADGAIKCKINVGGTVVTRTIASFE